MEPVSGKRTRDNEARGEKSGAAESKRIKSTPPIDRAKVRRDEERRKIEAGYSDLPSLPPRIPPPEYLVHGQDTYSKDNASLEFYAACARGDLDEVRMFKANSECPHGDLQYGLEKATHALQIEVVRYLLEERDTMLHTRLFENEDKSRPWVRSIFSYSSPKLLPLLKAFLDAGWHPNQVLSDGQHKVALHHTCCLKDISILRLLLEHGADPTISRCLYRSAIFQLHPTEAPVLRKSGDVLNSAVMESSIEAVDLLLSHGARLEYGRTLHCLVQSRQHLPSDDTAGLSIDKSRHKMADHLLSIGENINGLKDVSDVVKSCSMIPIGGVFEATPLSHAVGSQDWAFVEWLLENGADPDAYDRIAFRNDISLYYNNGRSNKKGNTLSELILKVKKR